MQPRFIRLVRTPTTPPYKKVHLLISGGRVLLQRSISYGNRSFEFWGILIQHAPIHIPALQVQWGPVKEPS